MIRENWRIMSPWRARETYYGKKRMDETTKDNGMNALSIRDLIEFDTDRRIKKKILYTERVVSDLLCYEPGQGTVIHHHNTDDEAFYVIEGRGTVSVDEEVYEVGPTSLVFAPMGKEHGIEAASDSRLVIIYFRSPGRKTSRPGLQPNLDG